MSWVTKLTKNIKGAASIDSPSSSPATSPRPERRASGFKADAAGRFDPPPQEPTSTTTLPTKPALTLDKPLQLPVKPLNAATPTTTTSAASTATSFARGLMSAAAGFAHTAAASASAGISGNPETQNNGSTNAPGKTAKLKDFSLFGLGDPARRKYNPSSLKNLFKRCVESRIEKERDEIFAEFLQIYIGLYGDTATPKVISESLDDLRTMTKLLCAYFTARISRVPEVKSKTEAAQALMKILRSPEQQYNSLKVIELLCCGPDYIFETMQQNQLPSTIVKIYRCFFDLPQLKEPQRPVVPSKDEVLPPSSSKSLKNNSVPPKPPPKSSGQPNSTQPTSHKSDVSDSAVLQIVGNILKHYMRKQVTLKGLVADDTLFMLVRAITSKPENYELTKQDRSFLAWKERTVNLFALMTQNPSFVLDPDTIVYLHAKSCMNVLVQGCSEICNDESSLTERSEEAVLIFRLIADLLNESSKKTSVLMGDFKEANGYDTLTVLLTTPPFGDEMAGTKKVFIALIEDMVFSGTDDLSPIVNEGTPFQHADFAMPNTAEGLKGPRVRNLDAFQVLMAAFLYPVPVPRFVTSPVTQREFKLPGLTRPPAHFRRAILASITNLIKINQLNYFLVERVNPLLLFIEHLDQFTPDVQKNIMDLLLHVVITLNYVPFKELAILCLHFQGISSADTISLVCTTITGLLSVSPRYKDVFREVGLLSMLSSLLHELTILMAERFGVTKNMSRQNSTGELVFLDDETPAERGKERQKIGPSVMDNFIPMMKCLSQLISDRRNARIFRKACKDSLFDLITYRPTRQGALFVIEKLIEDDHTAVDDTIVVSATSPASPASPGRTSEFGKLVEVLQSATRFDFDLKIDVLRSIQHVFVVHPTIKDEFRTSGGYVCLISLLIGLEGIYNEKEKTGDHQDGQAKESNPPNNQVDSRATRLLQIIFVVLAESFSQHAFNRAFFESHIGYKSLEDGVRLTGALGPNGIPEIVLGMLFGAAVEDPSIYDLFLAKPSSSEESDSDAEDDDVQVPETTTKDANDIIEEAIHDILGSPSVVVYNSSLLVSAVNLLAHVEGNNALCLNMLVAIHALVYGSRRNQVSINQGVILMLMLERLYSEDSSVEKRPVDDVSSLKKRSLLMGIIRRLIEMGVTTTEMRFLIRRLERVGISSDIQLEMKKRELIYSEEGSEPKPDEEDGRLLDMLDLLLYAAKYCRWPAFIQFDMSDSGYACLDIPSLGDKTMPPVNTGYTFMAWIQVERFDEDMPVTLLYLADVDKKFFEHIYIESGQVRKLIVRTSAKHTVKFESFAFREGYWYHLVLVHNRPRLSMSASTMTMYVDGILVEQLKCHYPSQPNPGRKLQCVIGTPEEIAFSNGGALPDLVWNLGASYLLEDVIEADTANVIFNLGPRYRGNFQDLLDQYQTYEVIDGVNLDFVNKGNEKGGELGHLAMVNAHVRGSNGQHLSEDRMYFSFFASNCFDESRGSHGDSAWRMLENEVGAAQGVFGGNLLLNSAIPKTERAFAVDEGLAFLLGNAVTANPTTFSDNVWKVGGCAIMLRLVERAETPNLLKKAVAALAEIIRFNARNTEDMERNHGYEILAHLLKPKAALITMDIFNILLMLVGRPINNPVEAILSNPFAYCYLFLDFDLWRNASNEVKRAHLNQFEDFLILSRKRAFNVKRISKMHPVKKMLVALRTDAIPESLLPNFIGALHIIVKTNFTTEVVRTLATFIVSTLSKGGRPRKVSFAIVDKASPKVRRRITLSSMRTNSAQEMENLATVETAPKMIMDAKAEQQLHPPNRMAKMRNLAFEMLLDIICDPNQSSYVNKFANTITSKWSLLFMEENADMYTVVLAMRMLARLLCTQGSNYVNKFRVSSEGFLVLERLLPFHWQLAQVHHSLIAILLGVDIVDVPLGTGFDLFSLLTVFKSDSAKIKVYCPEALHVLLLLMEQGLNTIVQESLSMSRQRDLSKSDTGSDRGSLTGLFVPARRRSKSYTEVTEELPEGTTATPSEADPETLKNLVTRERLTKIAHLEQTLVLFFTDMFANSSDVKDLFYRAEVIDDIVDILFPIICACDEVPIETELFSKDSSLTFDADVVLESHMNAGGSKSNDQLDDEEFNVVIPTTERSMQQTSAKGAYPSNMLNRRPSKTSLRSISRTSISSVENADARECIALKNSSMESVLEFLVAICVDSIIGISSKPLYSLEMALKSYPPSFKEHRIQFQSYLLTHVTSSLKSTLQLDQNLMVDSRVLGNVARYTTVVVDIVYQGWFINGADLAYDFLANLLECLQNMESQGTRRVMRGEPAIALLYRQLNRIVLYRLSLTEFEVGKVDEQICTSTLDKLIYHQKIIFSAFNLDQDFLRCVCHHLHRYLSYEGSGVRASAMNVWKLLVLQKPAEMALILRAKVKGIEYRELVDGFSKLLEMDLNSFTSWMDTRKDELNILFQENISRVWDHIMAGEQKSSKDNLRLSHVKRMNKLKRMYKRNSAQSTMFSQYLIKNSIWARGIQDIVTVRHHKYLQDAMDNANFIAEEWTRLSSDLLRERAIWEPNDGVPARWRLDFLEGRCRMRKKLQVNRDFYTQYPHMRQSLTPDPSVAKSSLVPSLADNLEPEQIPTSPSLLSPSTPRDDISSKADLECVQSPSEQVTPMDGEQNLSGADEGPIIPDADQLEKVADNAEEEAENEKETEDTALDDDKNRKILKLLDSGDVVMEVYNVSRVMGLDACEGLFLLCRNNIYLIDNYFQRTDGEVVEVADVPEQERDPYLLLLAAHSGSSGSSLGASVHKHECRKCGFEDIREVHKRKFLFRNVALEIFLADGRNYLITLDIKIRDVVYNKLIARMSSSVTATESVAGTTSTDPDSALAAKLTSLLGGSALAELTQRWERRDITNFQYLMHLNTLAGRSYNDLTQYPVFPWVISDYESSKLDLTDPAVYRDLSKPMGAQSPVRAEEFVNRYNCWEDPAGSTPAFHFGTHYSSAMIVCSYLLRLEPFTKQYLKLQGGHFDHADRLFHSIGRTWLSASKQNTTDVRELIPEFFYLPEFLENANNFKFGSKQGTGEVIDEVILPPWARNDPKLFIQKQREALEGEYVSTHLHEWIDLIFGYKQQGPAAVEAINVFHHLSYEGAVDIDAIADPIEKSATIGIINNFGQTPRQLFKKSHPPRGPELNDPNANGYYKLHKHCELLIQSMAPLKDISAPVGEIRVVNDKMVAGTVQKAFVPPTCVRYVEWGFSDNSLRLYHTDSGKLLGVFENMHLDLITCACFADERTLVTGSLDTIIGVWKFKAGKTPDFTFVEALRGHTDSITAVAVSRPWSIIVSGSEDTTCIVWDLNRTKYTRQLIGHECGVQVISINDTTGDIITCAGATIRIWTINGELIVCKSTSQIGDPILCSIFYEGKNNEWIEKPMILTGHKKGIVKIWNCVVNPYEEESKQKARWDLILRHQLEHEDKRSTGIPGVSDIIAVHASSLQRLVYTGDSQGRVYAWVLPDGSGDHHWIKDSSRETCMSCGIRFAVLERKHHCRPCGGIFCSNCTDTPTICADKSTRWCERCTRTLKIPSVTRWPLSGGAANEKRIDT